MADSRDIYIAIMVAAAKGKGLRLSADEVWALAQDDAVETRATNGLSAAETAKIGERRSWECINPRERRAPANVIAGGSDGR